MNWTDEQLIIVMHAASKADHGCTVCIKLVLTEFLDLTDWSLLERMEGLHQKVEWKYEDDWIFSKPKKE